MKDNFSQQASLYAAFRPHYPPELYEYIIGCVKNKNTAWDCGTGNGQCAVQLSKYFKKVWATDISEKQLQHATKADNIIYTVQPAEQTAFENRSVDLITVAQAIHWFRFDDFYSEVRRVAAPGATIAVWCYSLLRVNDAINQLLDDFHYHTLKDYWDPERKYIDEAYRNVPFPFEKIESPAFFIERNWTPQHLSGYLHTWSAIQKYIAVHHHSPIPALMEKIQPYWSNDQTLKIIFPLHLVLGKV